MNFQQTAIEYVIAIGFRPVASHYQSVKELMFQKDDRRIGIAVYGASYYALDEDNDWEEQGSFGVPLDMNDEAKIVFLFAGIGAIPVAELNRERMKDAPSLSRQKMPI